MSDYRRYFVEGGTYFFTLVTWCRQRLFISEDRVEWLRESARCVQERMPFDFVAGVILPDHLHVLWSLPPGDADYSKRIGLWKTEFTRRAIASGVVGQDRTESRHRKREGGYWQRRFWEHTIKDEDDFEKHFDYLHHNPVKHGYAACPHAWQWSSFMRWVGKGVYDSRWGCQCENRIFVPPDFRSIAESVGE